MLSTILSTTSSIGTFVTIGVNEAESAVVLCLIVFLSVSDILSASNLWNKNLSHSLNLAIMPLFVTVVEIILFDMYKAF